MPTALVKKCPKCGRTKPLSEFYHNSTSPDMHGGICKNCQLRVNEQRTKNKE
jgi:hypothetical protein